MNVNIVIIAGNLTRDPELRWTPKGTAVCQFGIAVNEKYKEKESVIFITCDAFGKTAEVINEHFHTGSRILVQGKLKQDSWDDKKTGEKKSKTHVLVDSFQFVDRKSGGNGERKQSMSKRVDPSEEAHFNGDPDPASDTPADDMPW